MGNSEKKIEYVDIVNAEKSSNLLAAPAFSLKRVKISLKRGFALVSPKDRDDFISELEKRTGK
ncbi:MAG: PH domain-containing protein [Candidatus Marinimicrobia bacterium]|nr:PH domain-containing protein [Candidatus Neomarinimicrobiota bacterium]